MSSSLRSLLSDLESSANSLSGPTLFAFSCYRGGTAVCMRNYGLRQVWGGESGVSHLTWNSELMLQPT